MFNQIGQNIQQGVAQAGNAVKNPFETFLDSIPATLKLIEDRLEKHGWSIDSVELSASFTPSVTVILKREKPKNK